MPVLPRNLPTTAPTAANDDYVQLDGTTSGSRKFLANQWAMLASPVFTGTPTAPTPTGAAPKALVTVDYLPTVSVPLTGGTMTGLLILSGNPVAALGAAPKQYVDTMLPKAGGTMTGYIVLHAAPDADMKAANKKYVDDADTIVATNAANALTIGLGTTLLKANNLSDLASASTARTNLGLGDLSALSVYESGELAIPTNTSSVGVTHGLSNRPRFFFIRLVCKTAEFGYAVDDTIACDVGLTSGGVFAVYATTTEVRFRYSNGVISIPRRDANGQGSITTANWRIVLSWIP